MDLKTYIDTNYSADICDIEIGSDPTYGAMTRFAKDINVKYQTVQRWLRNGYVVHDGCVLRKVHVLY